MCRTNKKSIQTCAELTKFDWDMWRTNKNQFGHVQNLQKSLRHVQNLQNSIRTCAELTKSNSDFRFEHVQNIQKSLRHVQNLQNSIRTCAELTKSNSDMCRTYKIGQNGESSKFGQMHAPPFKH